MIAILTLTYKNIRKSAWSGLIDLIRFLMTFLADLLLSYLVAEGLQWPVASQ